MSIKVSKARWQQIQSVLDEVLEQPEHKQADYLKKVCANDLDLQTDIEALLNAEKDAPSFLEQPVIDLAKTLFESATNEHESSSSNEQNAQLQGQEIYPYRLCELIGKGGMGAVYRAERIGGDFEQEVAIKLLSINENDQSKNNESLARFKQEQQTLASLNHPNIARLYDGGLLNNKQPYIVMELVKGVDITRYCKEQNLGLKARLKLIIQVAEVLAFAHANLIIHRDIKPSNIMINETAQVKLLDFGIAKLVDPTTQTDLTKTSDSLLTPQFAAPEQIKRLNITIATDIYQLGLVMYELITHHKAFSDKAHSLYELAQVICEQSPTLPSEIAQQENNDEKAPAWWSKLSGDIDAICMKALRTEASSRYRSMNEFIDDINASLNGHIVQARQKNMQYLFTTYCKRNWKFLLVGSSFLTVLIIYAMTVTLQSKRIQQALDKSIIETEKAQQVSNFMSEIFKSSDPNVVGLESISAKELLERGQSDIEQNLQNAPEIKAHMLGVIGDIYYSQGEYEQSANIIKQVLDQALQSSETDKLRVANLRTKLAISLRRVNKAEESARLLEQSLATYSPIFTNKQSSESVDNLVVIDYAEALNAYASLIGEKGDIERAKQLFMESLDILSVLPTVHNEMAVAYNGLAGMQHLQGEFTASVNNMHKGLEILEQVHGEQHSYFTRSLNNLVVILTNLERFDEAERLNQRSYDIQSNMLGEQHPDVASTLRSLGVLAHQKGELHKAKDYLNQALAVARHNISEDNISVAFIQLFLGAVQQDMGEFNDAQNAYQSMIEILQKANITGSLLGRALCQPASLAFAQGDWQEAQRLYQQAVDLIPEGGRRASIAQIGLAQAMLKTESDLEKAELFARKSLQSRIEQYPMGHSTIAEAQSVLGQILLRKDNKIDAANLLESSLAVLEKHILYAKRAGKTNLLDDTRAALEQAK